MRFQSHLYVLSHTCSSTAVTHVHWYLEQLFSRIAGMLAYSEAIIGQMYLSILVARLIGMHLYTVKNNTPAE